MFCRTAASPMATVSRMLRPTSCPMQGRRRTPRAAVPATAGSLRWSGWWDDFWEWCDERDLKRLRLRWPGEGLNRFHGPRRPPTITQGFERLDLDDFSRMFQRLRWPEARPKTFGTFGACVSCATAACARRLGCERGVPASPVIPGSTLALDSSAPFVVRTGHRKGAGCAQRTKPVRGLRHPTGRRAPSSPPAQRCGASNNPPPTPRKCLESLTKAA